MQKEIGPENIHDLDSVVFFFSTYSFNIFLSFPGFHGALPCPPGTIRLGLVLRHAFPPSVPPCIPGVRHKGG